MPADNEIRQLDNGKWSFAGMEFASEEAAKLFAERGKSIEQFDSKKPRPWLFASVAVILVGGILWVASGESSRGSVKKYPMDTVSATSEADALFICQQAIKRASLDAEKTSVPYVRAQAGGQDYYFAWNNDTKLVRARNGLGLEVGATASCIVSRYGGRILSLTVQGKALI